MVPHDLATPNVQDSEMVEQLLKQSYIKPENFYMFLDYMMSFSEFHWSVMFNLTPEVLNDSLARHVSHKALGKFI